MTVRDLAPASLSATARQPTCAWCGSPARPAGERLATCGRCGAATTHPAPDDTELAAAYSGWYRPSGGRFAGPGDALLRRSRATLAGRIERRAPPGPVLDVGCGDGTLLDALAAAGREATGLERESTRPDVVQRDVRSLRAERDGEWAAVVFWHSLEHLREPGSALAAGCELLEPDGLLIIAVPNFASWQSRLFGARWFARDLPRHLVHLPAEALLDGIRAHGMRVERVSYWRGGQVAFGWLHGLVGTLPGRPDLYDAIRRAPARSRTLGTAGRAGAIAAAVALAPAALALAAAEIAGRAGGTVYVEARRP